MKRVGKLICPNCGEETLVKGSFAAPRKGVTVSYDYIRGYLCLDDECLSFYKLGDSNVEEAQI